MSTITQIRKNIATIDAEIATVEAALPPREQLEAQAVAAIDMLVEPAVLLRQRVAAAVQRGRSAKLADLIADWHRPEQRAGLGLAIAIELAGGPEAILAAALEGAPEEAGTLRMPSAERAARLEELRLRRHGLELEEEALLAESGGDRRPDAGMAAYLGIPVAVAAEAGLFREARP
jgi:hypothetical protein